MTNTALRQEVQQRDHGGGIDGAMARFGGARSDWIDLSTGINPRPYPLGGFAPEDWTALPDTRAFDRLIEAARRFWRVPDGADILPAPGASALIARLPALAPAQNVAIPGPTYNEHAAAFSAQGWNVLTTLPASGARVLVHPNNPDGRWWDGSDIRSPLTVIDESFCDIAPDRSLIAQTTRPDVVLLKSFGKFWGLAGLRLGFAIGAPETISRLRDLTGPWAVSGPALRVGAAALGNQAWAEDTRARLRRDRQRLDQILRSAGAEIVGGTDLFGLYDVPNAARWQKRLARAQIWSRIFPYSTTWLRLGLTVDDGWTRLEEALQ